LKLTFAKSGLDKTPSTFIVEDLNWKKDTKVQLNDQVLSMNGEKFVSMVQVKNIVFGAKEDQDSITLELVRNDKKLKVNEPFEIHKDVLPNVNNINYQRSLFQ
jgi:hypothetical protein